MIEKGIITSIEGKKITVLPILKDACATCTASCSKQGPDITVCNPKNLQIKKGSLVTLSASKKMQALQGIISLLFPFMCAVAGYFVAAPVMKLFGIELTATRGDGFRALFVLIFLALSSAIIFIVTRKKPLPGTPEIMEVI